MLFFLNAMHWGIYLSSIYTTGLATFLASDDASKITGQTIFVDSGLSAIDYHQ